MTDFYEICYGRDGASGFVGGLYFGSFDEKAFKDVKRYLKKLIQDVQNGVPLSRGDVATMCNMFSEISSYDEEDIVLAKDELLNIVEVLYDKDINSFRGKNAFLSNFYDCPVMYDGITYKNAEAAFQAQKCMDPERKLRFAGMTASGAKRAGKRVPLREDWETVKVDIMRSVVKAKFEQNPDLAERLINTGNAKLSEGNLWHDIFWGVDSETGEGANMLGIILMEVRSEL